jgi:tetratricopeptide (TPR) repeat protein
MIFSHQLTAIMFTDIVGFTALMGNDEHRAMTILTKNRKIHQLHIENYNGKFLKEMGDGILASFSSILDAVYCAGRIQKDAKKEDYPLKIGIHLGETIIDNNDVFGDGVNIASRIVDQTPAHKIWVSETVSDSITNKKEIESVFIMATDLKNVAKSINLYEISVNVDLLPDFKDRGISILFSSSIFRILWRKKVPQILAGYVGVGWLLIEFIDSLLDRYLLSSGWTDILTVLLLAMIPSVIFYAYNRERTKIGKRSILGRITIPANILSAIILIITLFRGVDLNAVTQTIMVTNEFGEEVERTIVKAKYKKEIPLFYFTQEVPDSSSLWLGPGIALALGLDLHQDKNLTVMWPDVAQGYRRFNPYSLNYNDFKPTLNEMIKYADKWRYSKFLAGSYRFEKDTFYITTKVHEMPSGDVIRKNSYSGVDFFALIDSISKQVKIDFLLPKSQIKLGRDAPVGDLLTYNFAAYHDFIIGFFDLVGPIIAFQYYLKSLEKDSTFAFSSLDLSRQYYYGGISSEAAQWSIDLAMRHRSRLSEAFEIETRALYYNIIKEQEMAQLLFEMQLDLDPANAGLKRNLHNQYNAMGKFEKSIALYENDTLKSSQEVLAYTYLYSGKLNEASTIFEKLQDTYLSYDEELFTIHLIAGDFQKAREYINSMRVQDPDMKEAHSNLLAAVDYLATSGQNEEAVKNIEGAYRYEVSERIFFLKSIANGYGLSLRDQMGAYIYLFPLSDYKYVTWQGKLLFTFVLNDNGKVIKRFSKLLGKDRWPFWFKQDSLIWQAEELLSNGKNEEALDAFRKAYELHPEHYYLANYIQHLEFILSPEYVSVKQVYKKYLGEYPEWDVSVIRKNNVYYINNIDGLDRILPLSENRFQSLSLYIQQYQFVEQDGRFIIQGFGLFE